MHQLYGVPTFIAELACRTLADYELGSSAPPDCGRGAACPVEVMRKDLTHAYARGLGSAMECTETRRSCFYRTRRRLGGIDWSYRGPITLRSRWCDPATGETVPRGWSASLHARLFGDGRVLNDPQKTVR